MDNFSARPALVEFAPLSDIRRPAAEDVSGTRAPAVQIRAPRLVEDANLQRFPRLGAPGSPATTRRRSPPGSLGPRVLPRRARSALVV